MELRLCILTTILLTGSIAFSQTVLVHCVDDKDNQPVPGVIIKAVSVPSKQLQAESITDENGDASLNITQYPADIEVEEGLYQAQHYTIKNAASALFSLRLKSASNQIDNIIVTGVARPTKADEAVSIYKIISSDDIRKQGAATITDALRNQIGTHIGNDPMLGSSVTMRGLSGNNIKILVDGLPINGRENGNIDLSQFNTTNVERIEMVQGPMSVMYGTDALGGVINIITKTNTHKWSAGVNTYYDNAGQYNFSVNGATKFGKSNISVNAGRNFFQGWDPDNKDTRSPLWSPKEQYFANLKYVYSFSEHAHISYSFDYMHEYLPIKGSDSGFSYYNRNATDMYFYTNRYIQRLQGKWKRGAHGYWESNNSLATYDRTRETYIVDLSTLDRTLSSAEGDQSHITFNDLTSRTTYNNKWGVVDFTAGYDINAELAKGDEKIPGGSKSTADYALFTTADIKATHRLTIQPGLRYGYNTSYSEPLTPSLSFIYKPDSRLSLRGSYVRGFRAPGLKELYLDFVDNNHNIFGNENLKAEYGHHFQLSGAYNLLNKEKRKGTISLTGYYDDVHNQISLIDTTIDSTSQQNLPVYVYGNIDHTRLFTTILNGEFELNHLAMNAAVSYSKSIYTETAPKGYISTTPSFHYWEATLNVTYNIPKWNADIAIYYKYTGSQPQLGGDIMGNAKFGSTTNDYHNIDASISKSFWKDRIQLTAGVHNLTNNVIIGFIGTSNNNAGSPHSAGSGVSLTTGRSFFASLSFQIAK